MYSRILKRFFDIVLSLIILILFCWLYLIIAVLVRVKLGSPVLFTQDRPGYKGRVFKLYKFRTMTDERDDNGELLDDEVRLTAFGNWLRSTSLDEIPEFINILKGDMSFIGPRPLLVQYLTLYSPEQRRRHDVRPGLTGYAQVHGRNSITWTEKFRLDVWYVDHISFGLDLKIIFDTVRTVIKREGINSETAATMDFFNGHN